MTLRGDISWISWLLKFNPMKYLGLFLMVFGPLAFIYLALYRSYSMFSAIVGSVLLLFIGFIIWLNGWDPYEDILDQTRMKTRLITLKEFFGLVEWYKWVLKYSFLKYVSLAIMILGPYYFFYKIIFLEMDINQNMIYSGATVCIGIVLWTVSWDPYS
jgi:hypothetical protein